MPERAIAARASLGVVFRDQGRLDASIEACLDAVAQVRAGDVKTRWPRRCC